MNRRDRKLLDAIAGKLLPSGGPWCPGCAVHHGKDVVNVKSADPMPCLICMAPTTWRLA